MHDHMRDRRFWIQTLVIAALGTAISIVAYIYTRPPVLRFDENYYYPLGESLIAGTHHEGYIIRPPLYPLFLAGIFKVLGTGFGAVLLIQSILRGAMIAGMAFLGKRYASKFAGLAGACLLAIYPLLIWTYSRFISEVLYIPLFLISFFLLERAVRSERYSDTAVAGVFAGVAALARSTSLFFTVLIAIWLVVRKSRSGRFSRRSFAGAGILVLMLLVTVSPWTIRNAVLYKALIPIDNAAAFNLYLVTSGKKIEDAAAEWETWGTQAERQREGLRRWREYLREDPAFHIKRAGKLIPRLFDTSRQPTLNSLAAIQYGGGSRQSIPVRRVLTVVVPLTFWLVTAGGIIGVVWLERRPYRRNLLIITVAYFILLHAMTLARPRYLLPVNALLAVYAGELISWGLSRLGLTRRSLP